MPVAFDANEGQFQDAVRFVAHAGGITAGFFDGAAVLNLRGGDALCMRFGGEAPAPERRSAARASYFLGDDPARWRADVASFERIVCRGVAPGVDLVWRGTQRALEYDLVVAPGADPSSASIDFDAVSAAVDPATGDLVLVTAGGSEVRHSRPRCFQTIGGARRDVPAEFFVEGTSARFGVGAYDRSRELVIDPTITQCTYFGGNQSEGFTSLALGPTGDLYFCGSTGSSDFPIVNAYQSQLVVVRRLDVFVSRLLADGSGIVYSTYVGGSYSGDGAAAICVDAQGDAYVAGATTSPDFPLLNPIQTYPGDLVSMYAFKLTAAGNALVYSTYLGGSGDEEVHSAALDASGAFVVAGHTRSANFPVVNARQPALLGKVDGFVTTINPAGTGFVFSTYHGGSGNSGGNGDWIQGCAVDSSGATYVVGTTDSPDMPLANALQTTPTPSFVAKYNASGTALVYGSYFGGSGTYATAIAVDAAGRAYVAGLAPSSDFPDAVGPPPPAGRMGGFVASLAPSGKALLASGFLGVASPSGTVVNSYLRVNAVAVDSSGGVVAAGNVTGTNLVTFNAVQPVYGGGINDGFVARLAGGSLVRQFATYFGSTGNNDACTDVAVDAQGNAIVAGYWETTGLPVVDALQATPAGSGDGYILRLTPLTPSPPFGLVAALEGEVAARLTWTDTSGDETGFEIQRRINTGAFTTYASVPAGTTTYLDPSVFASVTYTYRVRAIGDEGPSAFSNDASVLRTGGTGVPPLPIAPDQLEALVVTPTEVALNWRDRSNDEIAFDVQRADGAGPWVSIGSAPQDLPAFSDTDVPAGWPVAYRVRALAPQGPSNFANPALVTTPATLSLTTTRGLVADFAQPGRDRVEWKASIAADEDAVLDPRATGLRLQAGPRDAPLTLDIPPDDPRWRSHRKRFTWTSPRDALARFHVTVDARRGTVAVTATRFEFPTLLDHPMRLLVAIGSEGGAAAETWVPGRKTGRLVPPRE